MRPSGKAGLPRWTGWLTQFAKTTGLSIGLGSQWTCQFVSFPFCTCTKHDPARNAKGMKSWNSEWNQERGLPQSLIWTIPMPTVFLILNIANRQHGGPFPADLARRGMLLRTLWNFFFLQYLVLYQRCKYFFSVLWPSAATQPTTHHNIWGLELFWLSKWGFKERYLPSLFKLCKLQITLIMLNLIIF